MADDGTIRKQEEDFTVAVDAALPIATALASSGKLEEAIQSLLPLEKKARLANDNASTSRLLVAIISLCFNMNEWNMLGEYVILLSKRRGQLKQAVTKMVQQACEYLEKAPDKETLLKLMDVLRTVTAGKIHVEIERARLTMKLAKMKEADGNIADAADILQELQVETFGSMDKREKVQFILEQMRLCLAHGDFIRAQILSKKISVRFFTEEAQHDLKLTYYQLMIKLAEHDANYLDICKYNRAIFDTPTVQADLTQWTTALQDAVMYVILSPYGNEQSDLVAHLRQEKKLKDIPVFQEILQIFTVIEVMPWNTFETTFGHTLRNTSVFSAASAESVARFEDLKKRVVEHNIRVMAKYYTRITIQRLSQLLDLNEEQTEKNLSALVVSKTVFAKIDRPSGIISFRERQDPNDVLQEWSNGITTLMQQVDKASHLITKERMLHKV